MLIVSLIILQLLIFGVLIFVFKKIMSQNVISATRHLDELNKDYIEKEKRVNIELEETKQKIRTLTIKAQEEAEKLKLEIINNAEAQRDSLVKQAHAQADEVIEQAEKSRKQLLLELDERISKEAVNKACELMQDTLPEEFKQLVHARWVEDLLNSGFSQIENLHIPEDLQEIKVVSAFSLTEQQHKILNKKLKDLFVREVKIIDEVNPKIVAGIVISIGSLVLDGSLKNKIQEKARECP